MSNKKYSADSFDPQLPQQFVEMCAPTPDLALDDCYSRMSGPPTIMWDVTNRCNLDCMHCYNQSGQHPVVRDMDTDAMLTVADQVLELRPFIVCMCGGEPLLRRDLEQLVSYLRRDIPHVNMVTNGWLLTARRLEQLREAGVKSIQISLDGASPLTHDNIRGMPGSWERAVGAIRLLVAEGMCPPVTLIPHRLNFHEIEEWAELCLELGVTNLRLMPLIPIGRARDNRELLYLDATERMEILCAVRRLRLRRPDISIEWGDPMEHIYNFSDLDNPMRTYSIEIRSDGKLVVSTYLPLIVGDLRRHTLREYWQAGLADVWRNPRVRAWAAGLRCLDDFADQTPQPWSGTDVEFDLIEQDIPQDHAKEEAS